MISRTLFSKEHDQFRDSLRRFMEQEVMPYHAGWEERGYVDREVWLKAGQAGFLCATMPEQYGGTGVDKLFSMVIFEELIRLGATGPGWGMHSDIVAPVPALPPYMSAMANSHRP